MDQPQHPAAPMTTSSSPPSSTNEAGPSPQQPPQKRRTGLKVVKWTVLVILLLAVAIGLILYINLNRVVRHVVQTQTQASTNLQTSLGGARLSLFGGSLDLDNLEIGSPQGFAAPHMLTLGNASVKVGFDELRGEPVKVNSITLDRPKLVIERGPDGQFNFKAAADQMPKTDTPPPDPNAKPLKLVISDLTIKDAVVVVRPGINLPGVAQEITVPIPTVNMKSIGSGDGAENGAAVKDVVMQVVTVLAAKATESGGLPDQLKQLMNVDLKGAVAQLGAEAQKRIKDAVPGPIGEMLGSVDPNALMKDPGAALKGEAQKKLGDLLGGKAGGSQPTSQPSSDPAKKAVEEGLQGLLGGKKKSEKK